MTPQSSNAIRTVVAIFDGLTSSNPIGCTTSKLKQLSAI